MSILQNCDSLALEYFKRVSSTPRIRKRQSIKQLKTKLGKKKKIQNS